jgi:hypothetical protein
MTCELELNIYNVFKDLRSFDKNIYQIKLQGIKFKILRNQLN